MVTLDELLVIPRYSFSEADYLAGVSRGTAKRWLKGYAYDTPTRRVHQPPVNFISSEYEGVSFLDLLEIVVIGRFRAHGFSLPQVRHIVTNCRSLLGIERPLTSLTFKVSGREVFVQTGQQLLEVGKRRGEQAWEKILRPFLEELDYGETFARRWWPLGKGEPIVVDPAFGFGQPVIADTGVRVEIIAELFAAGESIDEIAEDFGIARKQVEAALRFDQQRRAA